MSKSRRPSKRAQSASRRKPAARAAATKRKSAKRKPKPRRGVIELKPIRDAIIIAVERLSKLTPTEAIKITIERLERCIAEFDAICDRETGNCGPNMDFPEP